jgi:hypothetical protein
LKNKQDHAHKTKACAIILISILETEPQVVAAAFDKLLAEGEIINEGVIFHSTSPSPLIDQAVKTLHNFFDKPPYVKNFSLFLRNYK